jgi:signal transduction histidine kinase
MIRLTSLKARLSFGFIPLLIVIVSLVTLIAHWEMEELLYGHIDHILLAKFHGLLAIVDAVPDWDEQKRRIDSMLGDSSNAEKTLYTIQDARGQGPNMSNAQAADSLNTGWDSWAEHPLGIPFSYHIQGTEYRLIRQSHAVGNTMYQVLVAYPSQSLHDQLHRFLWFLLGLGAVLVTVAIALAWGAVHWALAPVNKAADLLRDISWSATGVADMHRLDVPSELQAFKTALRNMLARLDQFLDKQKQFTANAAHELRTPLTLAKSTVQTALYRLRDPEHSQQAMTDVLADLDRMAHLIDRLQMLSYLDETEHVPEPVAIPLNELLQEIATSYAQAAPGRILTEGLACVTVSGNRELLLCLFKNLLDNALKHGPADGSVQICMRCVSDLRTICVEVHDGGGGIPEGELARLTERFYRTDASRSRHTGGSGLGLAIAHEITKKHQGRLMIRSDPQQGTCVTVQLPMDS